MCNLYWFYDLHFQVFFLNLCNFDVLLDDQGSLGAGQEPPTYWLVEGESGVDMDHTHLAAKC